MKTGPITTAQANRFKDNLTGFIHGVINSQKGLSIPEDSTLVLCIQVVEAGMDLDNCFGAFMDSRQQGMNSTPYKHD